MSKFAIPSTTLAMPSSVSRPRRRSINASKSIVTSNVEVVTKASKHINKLNLANGLSFSMSDKTEFLTSCLCWAMLRKKDGSGRCYETEQTRFQRIQALVQKVGGEFAAKTALMIRILDGGRSISHILAAFIAPLASGESWAEDFYYQIAVRPDDMCEILAAVWRFNGKPRKNQNPSQTGIPPLVKMKVPRALRDGFARRFQKFDEYRLAKYANKSTNPSLRQVMMLVRPRPVNEAQSLVFRKLLTNELVNTDTWEAQLSAAGQEGKSKGEAWASLIANHKLLPLGLLKNLRNIGANCTEEVVDEACNQLRDAQTIKNCGILPAQYLTAYGALTGNSYATKLKLAIDDSVEIAAGNIPSIGKRVLIAIDESGSMVAEREPAAIFAASLLKSNPKADVMFFADTARYQTFNHKLPIMELIQEIRSSMRRGSTNFNAVFNLAKPGYDTIVLLSDQEGWVKGGAPNQARQAYVNRSGSNPIIFSFDLGGDGSLMFKEDSVITIAGSSFLVFKFLSYLKMERTKLVDIVNSVEIGKPMPTFGEEED